MGYQGQDVHHPRTRTIEPNDNLQTSAEDGGAAQADLDAFRPTRNPARPRSKTDRPVHRITDSRARRRVLCDDGPNRSGEKVERLANATLTLRSARKAAARMAKFAQDEEGVR